MPANRFLEKAEVEVYANTLLDSLNSEGGVDAVIEARTQMEQVVAYNRSNIDLTKTAEDPLIAPEERARLIQNVFAEASPAVASMLGVMAERGGMSTLPRVLALYNELIRNKLGVTVVDVITRVPLDDHLRELIKNKAHAELGGDVVLREQIDETMLGGIIMNADGQRIDASMNTMLETARVALKRA